MEREEVSRYSSPSDARKHGQKQRFQVSKARPGAGVLAGGPVPGNGGQQPKQVKFKVAYCSGEDPEFPASELNTHSPQTRGWQSPPFCAYPQEIGLMFLNGDVQLSQLQILSHESKIATKIDVYVGRGETYENCTFKRLGHLSLDDNERSEFAARELKSVYIGKQGRFLKLLIHKCHLNRHNIYNQAGIIAINVLGLELPPQQQVQQQQQQRTLGSSRSNQETYMPPVTQKQVPPYEDLALDMNFDQQTAQRMREIHQAKDRAVQDEEYEIAKRLKNAENYLKQVGVQLARLEQAKRDAVRREEYDEAATIKQEIDAIREEVDQETLPLLGHDLPARSSARSAPRGSGRRHVEQQPQHQPMASARSGIFDAPSPVPQQQHHHQFHEEPHTEFPPINNNHSVAGSPTPSSYQRQSNQYSTEDRPLPALQAAASGDVSPHMRMESARSLHENSFSNQDESNGNIPATDPAVVEEALGGVQGLDQLPDAEPLPTALAGEVQPLISVFKEYLVRCLYSRNVRLRGAALTKLEMDISNYNLDDPRIFSAFCTMIGLAASDKIANIYLQAVKLLELSSTKANRGGRLKRGDVVPLLEPIMPTVIEKLGNNASRIREASAQILMHLAGLKLVGPSFVASFVLKLLRPGKTMLWRQLLGRLKVLADMISEFQISEEAGLGLEPVMRLIIANSGHTHPNAEVRDCAKEVVMQVYAHVGDAVLPYLKDLRPKQMEEYEAGFAQIDESNGKPISSARKAAKQAVAGGGSPKTSARSKASPAKSARKKNNSSPKRDRQPSSDDEFDEELGDDEGFDHKTNNNNKKKNGNRNDGGSPINININLNNQNQADADDGEEEEEDPFTCQFCHRYDENFTEDALDLHYWRECPMLTSCAQCDQIIEVSQLNDHLLQECEKRDNHKQCPRCNEAISSQYFQQHVKRGACQPAKPLSKASRCSLCHKDIPPGPEGWQQHILKAPGCPKNIRTKSLR